MINFPTKRAITITILFKKYPSTTSILTNISILKLFYFSTFIPNCQFLFFSKITHNILGIILYNLYDIINEQQYQQYSADYFEFD